MDNNDIVNRLYDFGGHLEVQVMNENGDRFEIDGISTMNTSNAVVIIMEMGAAIR